MRRLEYFLSTGGKLMRCGYTTGTCAAAATRAAADLLLGGVCPPSVVVETPAGVRVIVDVEDATRERGWARCAVMKDGGDDPDVTDGITIVSTVRMTTESGIAIEGGSGVGRVTQPGLDQPPGAAAINSVPRKMIEDAARASAERHAYDGGLAIEISIPEGARIAEHTFNPRLGILGGLSVLGTSGIVRPMSEDALVASINLELAMAREQGRTDLIVCPGNIGLTFAQTSLGLTATDDALICSNFLGPTIDEASRLGFSSLLLIGHAGKMVKVAAGAMNTHSRVVDGRAEVLGAHAALSGAPREVVERVFEAPTTEAMLSVLDEAGFLGPTMAGVMERIGCHLRLRASDGLDVEAVVFTSRHGEVGRTDGATRLLALHHDNGRKA